VAFAINWWPCSLGNHQNWGSQTRTAIAKTIFHKLPFNFGVWESWTLPFLIVSTKDRTTTTARTINGSTSRILRRVSLTSGWTDVVVRDFFGGTYRSMYSNDIFLYIVHIYICMYIDNFPYYVQAKIQRCLWTLVVFRGLTY
jgi:hypothetical protein